MTERWYDNPASMQAEIESGLSDEDMEAAAAFLASPPVPVDYDTFMSNGNALWSLGVVGNAFKQAGRGDEWPAIRAEATSGDHTHLLATLLQHIELVGVGEEDEDA